jgi:hypothetical protein
MFWVSYASLMIMALLLLAAIVAIMLVVFRRW